ncbi:MAG: TolC family protein [Fibrobacteraceae bacterium]|nr:TolC family protein [Fibrobacteraceae bacterium]
MKKTRTVILAILASTSLALAGGAWTLEDCLNQAKKESLQLTTAKLREQQAEVNIRQAKIGDYPTVSAHINNTLYDSPFAPGPQDHYRFQAGLSGSMVLWNGGATSLSVEANQLSKQASQMATKQTERNVQENVINIYMSMLASMENIRIAQSSVELAQAEFEHYGKLYEAGSITKKDLTQSQSNVLQKQVSLLTAEQTLNTTTTSMRQLLELDQNQEFSVTAPETSFVSPDSLPALPTLEELSREAERTHAGLKSDSLSVAAAQKNTKLAGKNNSISVTLGANAQTGFQAWESDRYGRQLKNGYNHSVTLGINIPIIDAGATENKILSAQISEQSSQIALQETSKNLQNNLEKLLLDAQAADLKWKAAILQVQAETEALSVAEEQRNAGALTYTDYLSQKNSLENARITLTQAKYTSLLSRKLLELYQGKLD